MEANDNLTDCPTTDSSLDKLGIKDVWFSFNNEYSWSDFENKTTAATLDKELNKLIKIV